MKEFVKCSPMESTKNPIKEIGEDWMLITAQKKDGSVNTMTAAWGGMGFLFKKPVCFLFIRPQRYTAEFTEESDTATVSFFDEQYKDALVFCGRNSGKTCNKIEKAGLHIRQFEEGIAFEEAKKVLVLKKLYKSELKEECFVDGAIPLQVYPAKDYHDVYIYEILSSFEEKDEK